MRFAGYVVLAGVLLLCGCGQQAQPVVEKVRFGAATAPRKAEFVKAVAAALKAFEDLDIPSTKIETIAQSNACPALVVRSESKNNPALCANAVSLALATVNLSFPGIGFRAEENRTWRILIPDEVEIPVSGPFDFGLFGKR